MDALDARTSLLLTHLMAQELAAMSRAEQKARLTECVELIAAHGDDLIFGGPHCRKALGALVDALAILAGQPGGVEFAGLRFVAPERT